MTHLGRTYIRVLYTEDLVDTKRTFNNHNSHGFIDLNQLVSKSAYGYQE